MKQRAVSTSSITGTFIVANIVLNIDRCRNYAETLVGGNNYIAGIFGDRYKDGTVAQDNTYIQNCYSVIGSGADTSTGIVSLNNASLSSSLSGDKVGNNYYFFDTWGLTNTAGRIFDSSNTRNESRRDFPAWLPMDTGRQ